MCADTRSNGFAQPCYRPPVPHVARVLDLRFEYRDALGVGQAEPRLSWRTVSEEPGWVQAGYEIEVDGEVLASVSSAESVLVPWPAQPLASRQERRVRVRVRDVQGSSSPWSGTIVVEAGLLQVEDWQARFVSPAVQLEATARLRREFHLPGSVERARLYVTALGVYELELNGAVIGDQVLSPGWTSYDHRLRYDTFDVTALVRTGANALGGTLADGWFRGRLGPGAMMQRSAIYGGSLALLAQLEITTADGGRHVVATDSTWTWAAGPVTRSSLYDGEDHDARLEQPGWSSPGFAATAWQPVEEMNRDLTTLHARIGPPVRRVEELPVQTISTSPSGATILDFGQNLVGRLCIKLDGPSGTEVQLRHAEVLEDGELCTEPLRTAMATDRYVLRGGGPEVWEPRFTFHGFRYAEISGWPGELDAGAVTAVVIHSDLRRTGWFNCSDERVNRLHDNVVWGMRGNFLDIPSDCPQRDERLGWTGDLTVFAPTACFLHDVSGFLASWLADLAAEQNAHQGVPFVVPNVMGDEWVGTAIWGDAAAAVPWTLYERTGDLGLLRDQYDSMSQWADWVLRMADEQRHWHNPFQFGDWLDPAAPPDDPAAGRTDPHLAGNAWLCRTLRILADTAALLGEGDDAIRYRAEERAARMAFASHYVDDDGALSSDSQTAHALVLAFDLLEGDDPRREVVGRRLVELVRAEGNRIGTGFAGTPILCDALCAAGAVEVAYDLLFQTEPPSWLYPVLHGATTIWERWDGIRPDGTRNPGEMNSFNHYALGAVADWLHRRVAGLAPAEPGYRRLLVHPLPDRRLEHATARHDTPYGTAEAGWRRSPGGVEVHALVPPSCSATVVLPDGSDPLVVGPGRHRWEVQW